jgi:hypothetical protein
LKSKVEPWTPYKKVVITFVFSLFQEKIQPGVNLLLMSSLDEVFGSRQNRENGDILANSESSSRLIVRNLSEPRGFSVLPAAMRVVLDERAERLGVEILRQVNIMRIQINLSSAVFMKILPDVVFLR